MNVVTAGDVRSAVAAVVSAALPGVPVYDYDPAGQATPPYLAVTCASGAHVAEPGGRYRRTYTFRIRYAAPSVEERLNAAEALADGLEQIAPGGTPCRAIRMRFSDEQGVLSFEADYALRLSREESPGVKMGSLVQEGIVDG